MNGKSFMQWWKNKKLMIRVSLTGCPFERILKPRKSINAWWKTSAGQGVIVNRLIITQYIL